MSAMLIDNAAGIFTGLPGAAMRATGQIRIRDGVIVEIGALEPMPGELRLDARGGVVYPGLISTHHHLFQSVMKGVKSGIDLPLAGWLRSVPYTFWSKIDGRVVKRRRRAFILSRRRKPVPPPQADRDVAATP